MIAIPWYFVDILGEIDLFAIIYFVVTFISLVWSTYAGTLVDKYNRKHLFMGENIFGAIVLLSVAAFGFFTGNVGWLLAAIVFGTTICVYNIHYPTLYAFAQELSDKKDYGRITSWIEVQGQVTTALSGGMASMLISGVDWKNPEILGIKLPFEHIFIEKWDLQHIFLADGVSYLLALSVILFIKYQPTLSRKIDEGNVIERLKIGFNFLKKYPVIFIFGNVAYMVFATILVNFNTLLPNYVKNGLSGDGSVFALSDMSFAVGSIAAGLFIQGIFSRTTTVFGNIVLTILAALAYSTLAINYDISVLYVMMFILGLSNAGSRILRVTYILHHIPNRVMGRTAGVFRVLNTSIRLLYIGIFALAFFVENVRWAYVFFAAILYVSAVVMIFWYKETVSVEVGE